MAEVRIQNVPLAAQKHVNIALRSVYGIGKTRALKICEKAGVQPSVKVKDLTDDQARAIQDIAGEYPLEGDLRRIVLTSIKRLRDLNCYRGLRHRRGLPCRGQRTRTNARTRKGPRGKQQTVKS
jgi:small subunit ribosomal protein S13